MLGVNLFIKRDDFTGVNLFGGNKVRKLEYLLGQAQKREECLKRVLLDIRRKYGPTAPKVIMKGKNMLEGATAIERSQQIGGHRA